MSKTTLASVLNRLVEQHTAKLRVALPAVVVSYNAERQTIVAQVQIRARFEDGAEAELPQLVDVPVHYPAGGGYVVSFPLAGGDPVLLLFSDRSLDEWKASGAMATPASTRKHQLTDAIAVPGVRAPGDALPASAVDGSKLIVGEVDGMQLRIGNGRAELGNASGELLALFDDAIAALETATTATALGPQPLDPATMTALGLVRSALASMKE